MKDIPIIFSAPMVLALREGRKTMTRRLLYSVRRVKEHGQVNSVRLAGHEPPGCGPDVYPTLSGWERVQSGDWLWVKENFYVGGGHDGESFGYAADLRPQDGPPKLTPCIHMPRRLSRITLTVTTTKIERLQAITHEDAEAEGVLCDMSVRGFRDHFAELWKRLHGPDSWETNPEVVALTFTVHQQNIDLIAKSKAA